MTRLDVLKKLEQRRRNRVDINKHAVSAIQYQADLRRQFDREWARAEKARIKGHLANHAGHRNSQLMRARYEELKSYA